MDTTQYQYSAMSNLVLQSNRKRGQANEPTGEPESLVGKIDFRQMGDRARLSKGSKPVIDRSEFVSELNLEDLKQSMDQESNDRSKSKPKSKSNAKSNYLIDITSNMLDGITYFPKSADSENILLLILDFCFRLLGGEETEAVVRSAADTVIDLLKSSDLSDAEKKNQLEVEVFEKQLTAPEFAQIASLAAKIKDHPKDTQENGSSMNVSNMNDQEGALAIIVDEDENENDDRAREILTNDSSEEDGDEEHDDEEENNEEDKSEDKSEKDLSKSIQNQPEEVQVRDIDEYWLQRYLSRKFKDAYELQEMSRQIMDLMTRACTDPSDYSVNFLENDLMELFDFQDSDIVQTLTNHYQAIVWCTRLAKAASEEEKTTLLDEMTNNGLQYLVEEYLGEVSDRKQSIENDESQKSDQMDILISDSSTKILEQINKFRDRTQSCPKPKKKVNLNDFVFEEGSHLMSNKKVVLPQGTRKFEHKTYQEIDIPPPARSKPAQDEHLISIKELPEWSHAAFTGIESLNRIQSKVFDAAFHSDGNLLICAPTGSGKTNVALLTILREISNHLDPATKRLALDEFKIVYIAPLKALVQEQVKTFSEKLCPFDIKVAELTGDLSMTKKAISETQVIITTPEKWDVITRKSSDLSYTNLVTLIIIDEIHLLHDERGPTLEAIVARTLRREEQTQEHVRLVGLSATLPNFHDVASFLHVDVNRNLFNFDASYRPCPLRQKFLGIREKKPIKRLKAINDACYDKVMDYAGKNQVLIFVHSRKETAKTARYLKDKAIEENTITKFIKPEAGAREVLRTASEDCQDLDLKDLLSYGFAIHHAGLTREDRQISENLFAEGVIQVLVSTATLAWGVNLPAHTVIIKGTQVYSPAKGAWVELSPQDVLQMLGRAGRPQFDSYGEGIIITSFQELQYYLSILNYQLPIESQLYSKLADVLNAEIALGTVRTRDEAINWFYYTYLYIRMLRCPALYKIGAEYSDDLQLLQKRSDLIHSAALTLHKAGLIVYDKSTGKFQSTEQGRIASHFYVSYSTMSRFIDLISPRSSIIGLLSIFCRADEFKLIPIRQEEKIELSKLLERVPVPVQEDANDVVSKINVLLQCYISRQKLNGFALVADMVYITQSASRIFRALFELAVSFKFSNSARALLEICKMVDHRMWPTMCPLRQFNRLPYDIIRSLERKDVPFFRYFDFQLEELIELIGKGYKEGQAVFDILKFFPRLNLKAQMQPISNSLLRFHLTITPNFEWSDEFHGSTEIFHIIVEDADRDTLLFSDVFILNKLHWDQEHFLTINVTIDAEAVTPPNFFVSLISDRWLGSEACTAIPTLDLSLPSASSQPSALLDLKSMPLKALRNDFYISLYHNRFDSFDKIHTQLFSALYNSEENVLIACPPGFDFSLCAELAIMHHWTLSNHGKIVFVSPIQEQAEFLYGKWKEMFSSLKAIGILSGDLPHDLKTLASSDLIIATCSQWESMCRRWQQNKSVQQVDLMICDKSYFVGISRYEENTGSIYESLISRMKFLTSQSELPLRIVIFSLPISDPKDLAKWINASSHLTFNFDLSLFNVEKYIQSFQISHFPSFMINIIRPCYSLLKENILNDPLHFSAIIFTPSRALTTYMAEELLNTSISDNSELIFDAISTKDDGTMKDSLVSKIIDNAVADLISKGLGIIHESMAQSDLSRVLDLYREGFVKILLISREMNYRLQHTGIHGHIVIVAGSQYYDGRDHHYQDYSVNEVLNMLGYAKVNISTDASNRALPKSKFHLLTQTVKKEYFKKALEEPLPVESLLHLDLHDLLICEIASRTIQNKQDAVDWITWTFMYRRLLKNPAFYGLNDTSPDGISEYLSDLVENHMNELTEANIISVDDEDDSVAPLDLAMIGSYYRISYLTLQSFSAHLSENVKLKGCLEILSTASELEDLIPIRKGESSLLSRIYQELPVKIAEEILDFESQAIKVYILICSYFSRFRLPIDLETDQSKMLKILPTLLHAMVDILSSQGFLHACLRPMKLCQMVVQACWDRDSLLLQVPYFSNITVTRAAQYGVKDVYDFQELSDDETRNKILESFTQPQINEIATFVNNYPMIEMDCKFLSKASYLEVSEQATLCVTLDRGLDDDEDVDSWSDQVVCARYRFKKHELYWIVVSDGPSLLGIRKVSIQQSSFEVKLDIVPTEPGNRVFKIMLLCDSYLGVDIEKSIHVTVKDAINDESSLT